MSINHLAKGDLNNKLCSISLFCYYLQFTSMRLNDIVTQTQPKTRSLTCWFGGKEGLENFVQSAFRDSHAVVLNGNMNLVAHFFCADPNGGLEVLSRLDFFLRHRIKCISNQIQNDTTHILW